MKTGTLLRVLSLALPVLMLALPAAPAAAQDRYPSKEIRILVGFHPGSAIEVTLRALVNAAAKHVGQPLVVVNKPGAAQVPAMTDLAAAEPDGYTIGMTTDSFFSLTVLQQKTRFSIDELAPLLGYAQFKHVLFTRADSPYRKYEDYIAFAKKNPGGMEYGGTGNGTTPDLLGKILARDAGVQLNYVPFKGSNEYVPNVMGNHVKSGIVAVSGISPQLKDGSLGLVLVFGDERLPEYPNVPTSEEKGIRNTDVLNTVLMLAVPRKLPADRVKFLHDAFRKAAEDPDFKRAMVPTGLDVKYFAPQEVERRIVRTREVGVPILRELKLLAN